MSIYKTIIKQIEYGNKLLAVLLDPDKIELEDIEDIITRVNASITTHILVGGSTVKPHKTQAIVKHIRAKTILPVIIFPGNIDQIAEDADAILFLSLISGRNADYLIGKHVEAAPILKRFNLEVIPTSYILVGTNNNSAVKLVTNTQPLDQKAIKIIADTALAGEYLGHKLVYIEAGSGAQNSVRPEVIRKVKESISIPLIIGGGIKNAAGIREAYNAGADMVVIGTAFEKNINFLDDLNINLEKQFTTTEEINSF